MIAHFTSRPIWVWSADRLIATQNITDAIWVLVNIDLGNDLLPDRSKSQQQQTLSYRSKEYTSRHLFYVECSWYMCFKIATVPQGISLHEHDYYNDVIMGAIASQVTCLTIVFSTVYVDTDQRKHQSSASLAFVWGIHRGPVNSLHKWPVTRKMFPFDDVIMESLISGEAEAG